MPKFSFRGRNINGLLIKGEREFNRVENLIDQLIEEGITPIDIVEVSDKPPFFSRSLSEPKKVKQEEMLIFCRQMHSLTKAGVPIIAALGQLIGLSRNPLLVKTLQSIRDKVTKGESFSTAMSHYPNVFTGVVISLLAAGESNGRLDEAFSLVANHLELENSTKKKVKEAIRYPITVLAVAAIAVAVINVFVVPQFSKLFSAFHSALPLPTRVLIGASNFTINYWPYMLGTIFFGFISIHYLLKKKAFKLQWDRYLLKVPLVGALIERILMAGFARTLSMLLKSGVALPQAIGLVSKVVDNSYAEDKILQLREKVEHGEGLAQAAQNISFFSPLVLQMLAVGEETGNTDNMLQEVAQLYEDEVNYDIKQLTSRLEPILLIFVAMVVLVLALGVFLPMWDMVNLVK